MEAPQRVGSNNESLLAMEPVQLLRDVTVGVIENVLRKAKDTCRRHTSPGRRAEQRQQQRFQNCIKLIENLTPAQLQELAEPFEAHRNQFEFSFLVLVRQGFMQHCAVHQYAEHAHDIELVNDDLDNMMPEFLHSVLRKVVRLHEVRDLKYFELEPLAKQVLVDQIFRQSLHELVREHARYVPVPPRSPDLSSVASPSEAAGRRSPSGSPISPQSRSRTRVSSVRSGASSVHSRGLTQSILGMHDAEQGDRSPSERRAATRHDHHPHPSPSEVSRVSEVYPHDSASQIGTPEPLRVPVPAPTVRLPATGAHRRGRAQSTLVVRCVNDEQQPPARAATDVGRRRDPSVCESNCSCSVCDRVDEGGRSALSGPSSTRSGPRPRAA
jgi:hypothetical protein